MVLQALTRYYDLLADDPDCPIAREGYSTANVSAALVLSQAGELIGILPQVDLRQEGKKAVERPRRMIVPEREMRTVGVKANFLCESAAYALGISEKDADKPSYAVERFRAFRELNLRLLEGLDCPEALAVSAFLRAHDPLLARGHPIIASQLELLLAGGNLVFILEGSYQFAHEAPQIRRAWEASRLGAALDQGQCLVTGEWTPIARLHPNLKGVRGAQSSGATLVGFNAPAYESYNRAKGQGWNAPTGARAAFAYTTALNFLLSRESDTPKFTIGDTTVVYWAESTSKAYSDLFAALFDPSAFDPQAEQPGRDPAANQRLREIAQKIKDGDPLDSSNLLADLDPNTSFYVLGLAPNAARVSVRFFLRDPFGQIVERVMAHYEDLAIVREYPNQPVRIPLYQILKETVSPKSSDQSPTPLLGGAILRAVLGNTPYPAALFYGLINRIRADMDDSKKRISKINYNRAAAIKAYLTRKLRNQPDSPLKETLCMALNEQSTHPAYLLGRLFAVLEKAQTDALGDVNATIKDRYFTTACANPASVFPVLLRLAQHHVAKAEYGYVSDRRIQDILGLFQMERNPIPRHLSLDDQGVFVLGYYHQRADLFKSRKTETNPSIPTTLA